MEGADTTTIEAHNIEVLGTKGFISKYRKFEL